MIRLQPAGLLAELPAGARDAVVRAGRSVHLDDGRPVFLQGDPSWSLGFVRGGHLKLVTTNEVARPFLSRMWGPGELFGHATAFDRLPRPGTATAVGGTELLVIDTDRFEQLQDEFPSLHAAVQRALTTCLLEAQSVAVDLATEGVGVRLARHLLRLAGASAAWSAVEADLEPAPECPCTDSAHCLITAPVTQQDVADAIGASREAAARELHCLRLAGVVATGRRHLLITDVRLLRARARWSADGPDLVLCGMCRCGRFRG